MPPVSSVSIAKIEVDDIPLELKLKLKGPLSRDLQHYRDAYQAEHGEAVELEILVAHMLGAYIERDKSFQTWLKARMRPGPA
jgi:hypothetical protein